MRGLDTDTGIEAGPSAVVPGEHVLRFVGLEQTVAAEVTQHPGSDDGLEALQELGCEVGGSVETEATS